MTSKQGLENSCAVTVKWTWFYELGAGGRDIHKVVDEIVDTEVQE
ncbi:hypothetical protein ACFL27_06300 [candidate division CSSED10-310 bacterium]|uniref:Uncharacterized protein n=1 Tax=candidate division CSSED10-310 bacterium TaxID=2855610 RepID=A0ABV6YUC2_UNCC1